MNQANSTLAGREIESDASGDDDLSSLRQPNLGQGAELFDLTVEGTRDIIAQPAAHPLSQRKDKSIEHSSGSVLSPTKVRDDTVCGDTILMDPFSVSPSKETVSMEANAPQRSLIRNGRSNALTGHNFSSVAVRAADREAPWDEHDNGQYINPSSLCTPKGKITPVTPTASMGSDRTYRSRLSTRKDCSVSPSPRRRRTGVWRTYKANVGKYDDVGGCA